VREKVYVKLTPAGYYDVFCSTEAAAAIEDFPCVNQVEGPSGKAQYQVFLDKRYSRGDFQAMLDEAFEVVGG